MLTHATSLSKGQFESKTDGSKALELIGLRNVARTLETPIRLDVDAVYYFSFLIQKVKAAAPFESQYFGFSFPTAGSPDNRRKLHCGMTSSCYPTMSHTEARLTVAPPQAVGETCMFVGKIVAGEHDPDQMMLRIYGPQERVTRSEKLIWNGVTPAKLDDTIFDQLLLVSSHSGHFLVDEIRIGTTWESVTSCVWHSPDQ